MTRLEQRPDTPRRERVWAESKAGGSEGAKMSRHLLPSSTGRARKLLILSEVVNRISARRGRSNSGPRGRKGRHCRWLWFSALILSEIPSFFPAFLPASGRVYLSRARLSKNLSSDILSYIAPACSPLNPEAIFRIRLESFVPPRKSALHRESWFIGNHYALHFIFGKLSRKLLDTAGFLWLLWSMRTVVVFNEKFHELNSCNAW